MTPQLWRVFWWQVARDVSRHPLLSALNIFSVALGITVYLAIQIANHSANRSFSASVDLAAGKAHLEVRGDVDEELWPKLASQPGVAAATGLVEGLVTLSDYPGEYLRVLGVDLFSGEPFRTFSLGGESPGWDLNQWLGAPGVIALGREFADRHGIRAGTRIRAGVNGEIREFTVLTLLDTSDTAVAGQNQRMAVMDIGWAQELFGRAGRLSAVHLRLADPEKAQSTAAALNQILPPDLRAEPPKQRSFQLQHMVSAFQLNLTALSMVSLLVGVFLLYNTISASVTRRRREIGILRSLGATRLEVRCLFLGEAGLFGVCGIALGSISGVLLSHALSAAVAKTVSSLYVLLSIDRVQPSPMEFLTAALFGLAAVMAGAWLPASEAARVEPVAALNQGAHIEYSIAGGKLRIMEAAALMLLGAATAWAAARGLGPALSFVSAFCILAGAALLAPALTRATGRIASAAVPASAILWRMAAENLRRSVHRNAVTVAALATAVAMLTGLTVMIHSFRQSVSAWIDRGIAADLFVAPAANEVIGPAATISPAIVAWWEKQPAVTAVDTVREHSVSFRSARSAAEESATLLVIRGDYRGNLQFLGGRDEEKASAVFRGNAVAVTESFARRFRTKEGEQLTLLTPRGAIAFQVAGIYKDYTRDHGVILINRAIFDHYWDDRGIQSLAIFLRPGAQWEPLADAFRAEFAREGEFATYSNRSLRTRILAIFDQTFAVTSMLRAVAAAVAVTGVYLSVMTLVLEREREIGTLRAIGSSSAQIQQLFTTESGLLGLAASLLGLAAGLVLAVLLTKVVNPAFFGWTIDMQIPWLPLVATPLWMAGAAVLAAWHPAWKTTRTLIASSIREE